MNRTLAAALAGVALLSLATGCSSDQKLSVPATRDLPNGVTLPGGAELPSNADAGSCHVNVTGDVTAEWTSTGSQSAVGYGPWIAERAGTSSPITMDASYLIINCQGNGANYVGFMPVNGVQIPMQPGTYTLDPADNVFGASQTGQITSLLGLEGTDTNWGLKSPGTLTITEFDEHHIAGTFSLPVTDVLAKMTGSSKGDALITGEFSYTNPN